jgi:hypothetical protein
MRKVKIIGNKTFWIILCTVIGFSIRQAIGQPTRSIKGMVIDGSTNQPIPFANVFLDGTTKGTSTDTTGYFTLTKIPIGKYQLIVSSLGYKSESKEIIINPLTELQVKIFLNSQDFALNEISVKGKRDRNWRRDFDEFKIKFVGPSEEATILNPQELLFDRTIEGLRVTASKPILIDNRLLGYRLEVTLKDFYAYSKINSIDYSAWIRFDTLIARSKQEAIHWQRSRVKAYRGSETHLFKSILEERVEEEGFKIIDSKAFTFFNPNQLLNLTLNSFQKELEIASMAKALMDDRLKSIRNATLIINKSKDDLRILPKDVYRIIYYNKIVPNAYRSVPGFQFPLSYLDVPQEGIPVWPNGQPKLPINYKRGGYFSMIRIDQQLPFDYDPITEEAKSILAMHTELADLQGIVRDSATNKPLAGVVVFINNGMRQCTTNRWGQFKLGNLEPGPYTLGFYLPEKKPITLRVNAQPNATASNQFTISLADQKITREYPIAPRFPVNSEWDILSHYFQTELIESKFTELTHITNLEDLRFAIDKKNVYVQSINPIVVEDATLGYRWIIHLNSATLKERSSQYKLVDFSGLVKMDTLPSKNKNIRRIRFARQYEYLQGTWKHIVNSMVDGSALENGYKFFIYQPSVKEKKRPVFKKITSKQLNELRPDSILSVIDNEVYLRIPKGLELHNTATNGRPKYYRRYRKQIIRLVSKIEEVNLPKNGGLPSQLTLLNYKTPILSKIPDDFFDPLASPTDPRVLTLIRDANLKQIKNWREKVYVNTDKSWYRSQDTIWFKAYMKYTNRQYQDSLSNVLHVELISSDQKVIRQSYCKIENGETEGGIVIPKDETGNCYLRAYTTWMKNFGEEFVKSLPILNADSLTIIGDNGNSSDVIPKNCILALKQENELTENYSLKLSLGTEAKNHSLSISIVDISQFPNISEPQTIQQFGDLFKADGSKLLRIVNPMEKGVSYYGKILQRDLATKDTLIVKGYAKNLNKIYYSKPFLGNKFQISFDFNDTTTLSFETKSRNGVAYENFEIKANDTLLVDFDPLILKYDIIKNAPVSLGQERKNIRPEIGKNQHAARSKNSNSFVLKGFDKPLKFKPQAAISNYSRGTFYWSPSLKLDTLGNATISGIALKTKGLFEIRLEGISADGDPIYIRKIVGGE